MRSLQALRPLVQTLVTIGIGLLAGALLMLPFGYSPIEAYKSLVLGALGSTRDRLEVLAFATPMMLTGITFAVGVRTGLFNIGAEGQVLLGAIGATAVAGLVGLPVGIHLVVATLAGMLAGALWALPAAWLKTWRGVHEVISTIMFNWIGLNLATYLAVEWLAQPGRAERTRPALETARYGLIGTGSTLTTVFFVAVLFCVGVYVYLWGTRAGYEMRLAGESPDAARYAGASAPRAVMLSFVIGGLAAGLAGASQILGRPPTYALYATMGNVTGFGFDGIGVALIGRNHPIGVILAAILYGALQHGSRFMEYEASVPTELVRAINGLIVLALALPELGAIVRRRLRRSTRSLAAPTYVTRET